MPEKYILGLKCESCNRTTGIIPLHVCEFDFGPLRVEYDYDAIKKDISREKIENRAPDMWRYLEFMPISGDEKPNTSLGTGYTPLLRARNLEKVLGVKELYVKNDTANPTHSFKDRVVEAAVAKAKEFGYNKIACASTGNLANAVAAHAAKAGLKAYVFIPDNLEKEKIVGTLIFKPTLVGVKGVYDDVNRLCSEIGQQNKDIAFVNINIRPYYGDGSKTYGYEIAEQLGWKSPAHVVVPSAGASLITKIYKAFKELHTTGLIEEPRTRMYSAQADGCAPVAQAIIENRDFIKPIPRGQINTIAKSIAIGNPADGVFAIEVIKKSSGYAAAVTDDEIREGVKILAQTEGIWTETAGGTTVAATKKLIEQGKIPRNDGSIVISITGDGYKTPDVVPFNGLEHVIEPKSQQFTNLLERLGE